MMNYFLTVSTMTRADPGAEILAMVVLTVERVIGIYITGEWARARFSNILCRTLDGAAGGMFDMREA